MFTKDGQMEVGTKAHEFRLFDFSSPVDFCLWNKNSQFSFNVCSCSLSWAQHKRTLMISVLRQSGVIRTSRLSCWFVLLH